LPKLVFGKILYAKTNTDGIIIIAAITPTHPAAGLSLKNIVNPPAKHPSEQSVIKPKLGTKTSATSNAALNTNKKTAKIIHQTIVISFQLSVISKK
jgi:hypothetical protein